MGRRGPGESSLPIAHDRPGYCARGELAAWPIARSTGPLVDPADSLKCPPHFKGYSFKLYALSEKFDLRQRRSSVDVRQSEPSDRRRVSPGLRSAPKLSTRR